MNYKIIRSSTGEPFFIIDEKGFDQFSVEKSKEEDPVLSSAEIEFRTLRQAGRDLVEVILETSPGKFLTLLVDLLASTLNEVSRK